MIGKNRMNAVDLRHALTGMTAALKRQLDSAAAAVHQTSDLATRALETGRYFGVQNALVDLHLLTGGEFGMPSEDMPLLPPRPAERTGP